MPLQGSGTNSFLGSDSIINQLQLMNVPKDFVCPITLEIMENPVIAADGHSYERTALENWLKNGTKTSLLTRKQLGHERMIENISLKKVIDDFKENISPLIQQLGKLVKSAPPTYESEKIVEIQESTEKRGDF